MTFFLPYYVAALALLYFELRGSAPPALWTPRLPSWAWISGLIATYAAQLAAIWYAASAVVASEPWRAHLPIAVAGHDYPYQGWVSGLLLVLSLAQSYALLALYRQPATRGGVLFGAIVMSALSLAAPAFISPDPYAYVGDALLGTASYAPPSTPFGGQFAPIDRFFAAPMLPSPYGPLWTVVAQLVTMPFGTSLRETDGAAGTRAPFVHRAARRAARVPRAASHRRDRGAESGAAAPIRRMRA